jgi:hypothetical protein
MDAKKMHTAREARVEAVIKDAPESVKGTLTQAFSGSASPRKAIKAQCLVCVGYDRNSIKNCTGYSCPLWMYRPFQE